MWQRHNSSQFKANLRSFLTFTPIYHAHSPHSNMPKWTPNTADDKKPTMAHQGPLGSNTSNQRRLIKSVYMYEQHQENPKPEDMARRIRYNTRHALDRIGQQEKVNDIIQSDPTISDLDTHLKKGVEGKKDVLDFFFKENILQTDQDKQALKASSSSANAPHPSYIKCKDIIERPIYDELDKTDLRNQIVYQSYRDNILSTTTTTSLLNREDIIRPIHETHLETTKQKLELKVISKLKSEEDQFFDNPIIQKFVNIVMRHGQKQKARRMVTDGLKELRLKTNHDPVQLFLKCVHLTSPTVGVLSKKKWTKTIQVPIPLTTQHQQRLALHWIREGVIAKKGFNRFFGPLFAQEVLDNLEGKGYAAHKKADMYRTALTNRAFINYRWS